MALARIVLARKYHRHVKIRPYPPRLEEMLDLADAALIIGDPALRLTTGLRVYDLGAEWDSFTQLPMVYAVWTVRRPAADRGIPADVARDYLTNNIRFGWGEPEARGLSLFLEYAADLGLVPRRPALDLLPEPALAL